MNHDAVYAHRPSVSSRKEVNLEKKDSTFDDDFLEVDTFGSSPHRRFLIQSVSPPSPSRARFPSPSRCKSKYHPMSINFVSLRYDGSQGHSSRLAVQEAQKETHILESNKEQTEAQGTRARKILGSTRDESSTLSGKSYLETPLPVKLLKHDKIPDTASTAFSEHTGSKENLVMSTVQLLDNALNAGPPSLSSKNELKQEKNNSSSGDEFWVQDAYDDSIVNEPSYICVLTRVSSSPSPPRTRSLSPPGRCQDKYHLTARNIVPLRAAPGKSQTKRNILSRAVSQQKALKETHTMELNKEQRKAQGTISRKKLEIKSNL